MRLIFLLLFTVTLHLSWCIISYAEISGSLEWDYGQYQADEGGVQVADSSYFAQRYALWFSRKGVFMGGRGGQYNLAIGGEWWGLNSDNYVNGVNYDLNINNAKFLYLGDLNFAPGGLPFQFRMYGHDTSASNFRRDRFYSQGSFDQLFLAPQTRSVLTPNIINDVNNGTRFEYGASATLGIKNGSYLGRYRNILAHMPKIYADYRETHVDDPYSVVPQKYRDRELAFVSLNKKHNWFHYRYFEHLDELIPLNSTYESIYLLGNIDNHLRREWISLTNWIQLSTDGSFTSRESKRSNLGVEQDYVVNFFVTTERRNWRSSLLSSFARYDNSNYLERKLLVPFYASGEPNRNNSWRFRMIGSRWLLNIPFAIVNAESLKDNIYTVLRLDTGRTARKISASELELEGKFGDRGQGGAVRAAYEYFSNKTLSHVDSYDMFSRLTAAYFQGTTEVLDNIDLFEATGQFDLAKQLNSRIRTGVGSFLLLGVGEAKTGVTEFIRPISLQKLKASLSVPDVTVDGTVWRIEGLWFIDHVSYSRISNRLETGIEYQDYQADSAGQYYLAHRLRYSTMPYSVDINSRFLYGDSIYTSLTSSFANIGNAGQEYDGGGFSNSSSFTYKPNRENHLGVGVSFDWRLPDQGETGYRVRMNEEYRYTRYLQRGVQRRLLELVQLFDYERVAPAGTQIYDALALTGVANYFPTSWARIGCKVRWQNDIWVGSSDLGYGLYTDLTFSLLSVGLEYEYGMRTADSSSAILDRDEQRWGISIRKIF